jgi:hypothetical protein
VRIFLARLLGFPVVPYRVVLVTANGNRWMPGKFNSREAATRKAQRVTYGRKDVVYLYVVQQ